MLVYKIWADKNQKKFLKRKDEKVIF